MFGLIVNKFISLISLIGSNAIALGALIGVIVNVIFNGIFYYFNNKSLINKIYREDTNKERVKLYDNVLVFFNRIRDESTLVYDEKFI